MKKLLNVIFIVFLIFIVLFPNFCYADRVITNFDGYKGPSSSSTKLNNVANAVTGTIMAVGTVISVITLAIIGVRYMMGSVEERAEYKKTLLPWMIGAIMVFAITTIPSIIYNMVHK